MKDRGIPPCGPREAAVKFPNTERKSREVLQFDTTASRPEYFDSEEATGGHVLRGADNLYDPAHPANRYRYMGMRNLDRRPDSFDESDW